MIKLCFTVYLAHVASTQMYTSQLKCFTGSRSSLHYEWNKFKIKSVLVNLSLCSGLACE